MKGGQQRGLNRVTNGGLSTNKAPYFLLSWVLWSLLNGVVNTRHRCYADKEDRITPGKEVNSYMGSLGHQMVH